MPEAEVKKKDVEIKGNVNGVDVLKMLIKGYEFDDVSEDWADGWSAAIKWSLDRIDEFYGIAKTERKLAELADQIDVPDKSDVIAKIVKTGKLK
ncbi:MAG: hypothetical protein K2K60_05020 [Clostridia bacterium]|nr:hypothetical protein [Clostridia bacterium]